MNNIELFIANSYDGSKKQFVPFMLRNLAENVMINAEDDETVADAIAGLKSNVLSVSNQLEAISDEGSGCGSVSGGVISHTYAELSALKADGGLVPGQLYQISDYATKYIQPGTEALKISEAEPLIVLAAADRQFCPVAYSAAYPYDVVYYSFDDNVCEDGVTERNGFIQRRIDTVNNIDAPNDWRTMVWVRYKAKGISLTPPASPPNPPPSTFTVGPGRVYESLSGDLYICIKMGTISAGSTDINYLAPLGFTSNDYVWASAVFPGMTLNGYAERYTFNQGGVTADYASNFSGVRPKDIKIEQGGDGLHNNVFTFETESGKPKAVTLLSGCRDNTFGQGCYNITLGQGCYNITLGQGCYDNTFGQGCYENILGRNCYSNSFEQGCCNNGFGTGCYGNTLKNGCRDVLFGNDCYVNEIGNCCSTVRIAKGCYNNKFGSGCSGVYFPYGCSCVHVKPGVKDCPIPVGLFSTGEYRDVVNVSNSFVVFAYGSSGYSLYHSFSSAIVQ